MPRLLGFLLVSCALALGGVWVAAQVDLTTFQPNTPILAAEVNANFSALEEAVAGLAERGAVEALNDLTGAVELVAGADIDLQVDPDSGTVTIASTATGGGGGDGVPSGAVMAFNRQACPAGWSIFASAQGRTVVGIGAAGTVDGTVGGSLGDLEGPLHAHTVGSQGLTTGSGGNHDHLWATFFVDDGEEVWEAGDGEEIFRWGNGIHNDGSGIYPLAVDGDATDNFFTGPSGNHSHTVNIPSTDTTTAAGHLPYVQLLYCQRD